MQTRRGFLVSAAASAIGLAALQLPFVPSVFAADSTLERIKKAGVLKFGTSNDVPYAFQDPRDGVIKGIDTDLLKAMATAVGIPRLEIVQVSFDGLVPGLLSGHFDIIADSMWITEKRLQQIDFSTPWYRYGDGVIVAKGNPSNVHALADLEPGMRAGAEAGTVYVDWLNAVPGLTVHVYSARSDAFQDIALGRLDALVIDAPVGAATLIEQKGLANRLEVATPYAAREVGMIGAGFRKADSDLKSAFDAAFGALQKKGDDLKILQAWGLTSANRTLIATN